MTAELIKEVRELTGAGMMDVKDALEEAGGDKEKAIEILRKKGIVKLGKKADRVAKEGVVESYIHAGGRIGVLVEVNCETDFVGRTDEFRQLAKEIALQVAASGPLYVSRENVPAEILQREKSIYLEETKGKPADVVEKIVLGKLEKYFQDVCLLDQAFVKEPEIKVAEYVARSVAKMGEKVQVRRFARFVLGD